MGVVKDVDTSVTFFLLFVFSLICYLLLPLGRSMHGTSTAKARVSKWCLAGQHGVTI